MPGSEELLQRALDVIDKERRSLKDHIPFRKVVLRLLEDAVRQGGAESLEKTEKLLTDMLEGEVVSLSDVTDDLLLASDLLAVMQQAEAATKRIVRQWVRLIVQELINLIRSL